jgi:hypothetical protein
MKNVRITLSDTNYTAKAVTEMNLKSKDFELLKSLIEKMEDGLYGESASFMAIEGLLDVPVKLTITECEHVV